MLNYNVYCIITLSVLLFSVNLIAFDRDSNLHDRFVCIADLLFIQFDQLHLRWPVIRVVLHEEPDRLALGLKVGVVDPEQRVILCGHFAYPVLEKKVLLSGPKYWSISDSGLEYYTRSYY